jgi:hypothetical protein
LRFFQKDDKALLGGDSDFLWGEFLSEIGAVDADEYQKKNQAFFDDYATKMLTKMPQANIKRI